MASQTDRCICNTHVIGIGRHLRIFFPGNAVKKTGDCKDKEDKDSRVFHMFYFTILLTVPFGEDINMSFRNCRSDNATIRAVMQILLKHIATLGPIGYMPLAPGTFGTLAALVCILVFPLSFFEHLIFFVAVTILGSFAATSAEKIFCQKDSSKIIIDEFAGFYIATLYIPHSLPLLMTSFILFRLFDILKPLMIRNLENALSNGMGVMADDILAGIYANMVVQVYLQVTVR